jgi:hypothetical protein
MDIKTSILNKDFQKLYCQIFDLSLNNKEIKLALDHDYNNCRSEIELNQEGEVNSDYLSKNQNIKNFDKNEGKNLNNKNYSNSTEIILKKPESVKRLGNVFK